MLGKPVVCVSRGGAKTFFIGGKRGQKTSEGWQMRKAYMLFHFSIAFTWTKVYMLFSFHFSFHYSGSPDGPAFTIQG